MSNRFGFITWRSHPNEKYLDNDFWSLIQPMLAKSNRYLVALEEEGTPCAHYHIMLEFVGDVTHLKQKFKTKTFNLFFNKIKLEKLETSFDKNFKDGCLNIKLVEKTEEDFYNMLGYLCKDNLKHSKGFTDDEVTMGCKYYHAKQRQQSPDAIIQSWKIPNIKTIHSFLEHYAKKWDIPIYSPMFKLKLAENRVSLAGVSKETISRVFNELIVANHPDYKSVSVYKAHVMDTADPNTLFGPEWSFVQQELRIEKLEALLLQNSIEY